MVRIILKNGDILKYPDATRVDWKYDYGIIFVRPTDNEENKYMGTFNFNNIAGWDYKDDVVNGFEKIGTVYRKV